MLGFSAGGNLVGHASWGRERRSYPQVQGVDDPRGPDFMIFVYGGGFRKVDEGWSTVGDEWALPADAPPCFFIAAGNDRET